ncbi:MAG: hypothetical protein PHE36_13905, partial [Novosphingobium sp.]|nr:hypothetical protein [Novosphingobium sp.]
KKFGVLVLAASLAGCGDLPEDEAATPSGPPVEVTAKDLFSAYEANEAAAQMKYGDKPLLVSGKVAGITLDFMDKPVVQLETSNEYMPAQASLVEADEPKAAELSKGQDIALLCAGVSEVIGSPQLSDCAIQ